MDNLNDPTPYNQEAECHILADIFQNPEALDYIAQYLVPNDFYNLSHKKIYTSMLDLYNAGKPFSPLHIKEYLQATNSLKQVGGWDYLQMLTGLMTPHKFEDTCELVKDTAIKRKSIEMALKIQDASKGVNWQDELKELSNNFNTILNERKIQDVEKSIMETFEEIPLEYKPLIGLSTGFVDLGYIVVGGFQKGQLVIVGARPSIGKTTFALNLMLLSELKTPNKKGVTVFYSLEQPIKQIHHRLFTIECDNKIKVSDLKTGNLSPEERAYIKYSAKRLGKLPLIFKRPVNTELSHFYYVLRQIRKKHKIDAIYIDHVGQMTIKGYENDGQREAFKISHGLQNFAAEMDCTIFALSQLKRAVEDRQDKRPKMSDLRQTGNWEQSADIIIGLYRDEYYNRQTEDKGIMEAEVLKQRDGALGRIKLHFDKDTLKLSDLETRRGEDPKVAWNKQREEKQNLWENEEDIKETPF